MTAANDYMISLVNESADELQRSGCSIVHSNGDLDPTHLGKIASYYYLVSLFASYAMVWVVRTNSTAVAQNRAQSSAACTA